MRTFDDIIPPSRRREAEPVSGAESQMSHRVPSRTPFVTIIVAVGVIVASAGALFYFSGATVEITPNAATAAVTGSFTATQSSGDLPYEIVSTKKLATQSVASSGTKTVSASASGTITVYNAASSAQKLIANTRFATTAGLIYRIHAPVTIPAGSARGPGVQSVTAYADRPGVAYNIGPSSFTLPGLAGTALAAKVYARSATAMTGGASGAVPLVDEATERAARSALAAALAGDLETGLKTQVPPGYLLIRGAATTTYAALASAPSAATGAADLKEEGTMTAVVFPAAALAKMIAVSVPGLGYQGEPLTIADASGLTLAPLTGLPDPSATSFSFMLSGNATLVYTVDPARIAAAVAGKSRSAAEVALTSYPEVKKAVLVLRPFWRQSFPQDPSAIAVSVAVAQP